MTDDNNTPDAPKAESKDKRSEFEKDAADLFKRLVSSHHFHTHQDKVDAEKLVRKVNNEPEPVEDEGPIDYQKKYEELLAKEGK